MSRVYDGPVFTRFCGITKGGLVAVCSWSETVVHPEDTLQSSLRVGESAWPVSE